MNALTFVDVVRTQIDHAIAALGGPDTAHHSVTVLADDPPINPKSVEPPGQVGEKIKTILGWLKYLVSAAGVAGMFITSARMMIAHRRGDDTNVSQLGWVLGACVLAAAAPWIVAALV